MKTIIALISGLLICSAANSLVAADYQITVKLQDFSNPDGIPINLEQGVADPTVLKKLIPGDILFMHRANLPTRGSVKEDVQIDKTEAHVSYSLGEEKAGKIAVTIALNVAKIVKIVDGVPVKSTQSLNTTIDCPIGQEIYMGGLKEELKCTGGVQQEEKKTCFFTISVTK